MPASVVGRDAELAAIDQFLAVIADGAIALVLEGDAGMGKTTLFEAALAEARERDVRVLVARPSESETELTFAGLGDLLAGQLDEVLDALPSAQQRALARALVLEEDEDAPSDPRAVGVAVQSALRALAASRTTMLAVDDVQWLDAASAGALSFACRRLGDDGTGLLIARRSGLRSSLVDELRRALGDRLGTVDVGPLDVVALNRLVHDRLGSTLPRPLVVEVWQASGGNPFFAIEIVRTLQRRGTAVEAGQPLPVPESLHELLDERLRTLPAECRDFLLAAAAHAHPTIAITEAAAEVDAAIGLGPALDAGIVELDGSRIRFTHPLLAACAYEAADPMRRTAIHLRLSEILEAPEARAWQLAAATNEPDQEVAVVLEEAARNARGRGAPRPAALLLDRAGELTPADRPAEAVRRAIDAAYMHYEAGDSPRAVQRLRSVVGDLASGRQRAMALTRLGRVRLYEALPEAAGLFRQAIDEAEADPRILADAHMGVADSLWYGMHALEEALEHGRLAEQLALELGDDGLASEAVANQWTVELLLGRDSTETAARALAAQEAATTRRMLTQPRFIAASDFLWLSGDLELARVELEELATESIDSGDESSIPLVLYHLGHVECELGDLASALRHARAGQDAAQQCGQQTSLAFNLALEGVVEARLGDGDRARATAHRALELVGTVGGHRTELSATAGLGHLELAREAYEAAAGWLDPLAEFARRELVEPCVIAFVIDLVEAQIQLGRTEEALGPLDWYEGNARRLERASALANCARCRGLLAAQAGDLDAALGAFAEALDWHAKVELPLDRGRTLLALGATQRRMKRRREARVTLEEALAIFERIGAALWAERTRAELKRISGRAATPGALTPAEERVAALVAEGKTNKEVAAALFLSDRTVEGHLARIFGKLGIRHRTELAGALQTRGIAQPNTGDSPVSAESVSP